MKKVSTVIVVLLIIFIGIGFFKKFTPINTIFPQNNLLEKSPRQSTIKTIMQISSPMFKNNQTIPGKYTCDGDNSNPPLTFSDVPQNAKSLVLIVDDPDAPAGTWVHWVVFNISPSTKEIMENSVPKNSIQGVTSFGKPNYGGPCPPLGTHRYFFKLYALDTSLSLDQNADKKAVETAIQGYILQQAELIGLYSRK